MEASAAIDPRFLDLALGLIALEGVGLLALRRFRGVGPRPVTLLANLAAGAFLILVARDLMTGAGAVWTVVALTAALVAHGVDLAARWERKPRAGV